MMTMRLLAAAALLASAFAAAADDAAVRRLLQEYGRSIGANSTPTWFIESGERFNGALPLEQVRRLLEAASAGNR
jgi:protein-disulfide isomerase